MAETQMPVSPGGRSPLQPGSRIAAGARPAATAQAAEGGAGPAFQRLVDAQGGPAQAGEGGADAGADALAPQPAAGTQGNTGPTPGPGRAYPSKPQAAGPASGGDDQADGAAPSSTNGSSPVFLLALRLEALQPGSVRATPPGAGVEDAPAEDEAGTDSASEPTGAEAPGVQPGLASAPMPPPSSAIVAPPPAPGEAPASDAAPSIAAAASRGLPGFDRGSVEADPRAQTGSIGVPSRFGSRPAVAPPGAAAARSEILGPPPAAAPLSDPAAAPDPVPALAPLLSGGAGAQAAAPTRVATEEVAPARQAEVTPAPIEGSTSTARARQGAANPVSLDPASPAAAPSEVGPPARALPMMGGGSGAPSPASPIGRAAEAISPQVGAAPGAAMPSSSASGRAPDAPGGTAFSTGAMGPSPGGFAAGPGIALSGGQPERASEPGPELRGVAPKAGASETGARGQEASAGDLQVSPSPALPEAAEVADGAAPPAPVAPALAALAAAPQAALGPAAPAHHPGQPGPALPQPTVPVVEQVPLRAVPVEIGLKSLAGVKRFEMRLEPPELGRVDVRLDIDGAGAVKATLVVDRVETLNLLQRDARSLERSFEQAGLRSAEGGIDLQLRDPGSGGRGPGGGDQGSPWGSHGAGQGAGQGAHQERRGPWMTARAEEQADPASARAPETRLIWRGSAGLDLRI